VIPDIDNLKMAAELKIAFSRLEHPNLKKTYSMRRLPSPDC
jgi:hypothetical protein